MKILFIRPIITERPDILEEDILREFALPGVEITARHLEFGPESIENEYDLIYSAPFVLEEAIKGEKDGFDGIISYCFANPAVDACREAVDIPVLGSGEASMTLASAVGRKIGIVTILPNIVPLIRKQNMEYINSSKLVSIRNANIPVVGINDGSDEIFNKLYNFCYLIFHLLPYHLLQIILVQVNLNSYLLLVHHSYLDVLEVCYLYF